MTKILRFELNAPPDAPPKLMPGGGFEDSKTTMSGSGRVTRGRCSEQRGAVTLPICLRDPERQTL